jgi:hypothetical protein
MKTKDAIAGKQIWNCYAIRQSPIILLHFTDGEEPFVRVVRISIAPQCYIWSLFVQGESLYKKKAVGAWNIRVHPHLASKPRMRRTMTSRWRMQHFRTVVSSMEMFLYIIFLRLKADRRCGLVFRVSGYRYRGPGFDSRRRPIFWVAVGLERGSIRLVRTIEELLGRNISGSLHH